MATINDANHTVSGIDLYFEPSVAHASLLATTGGVTVGSPFRTSARNLGNIVTSEINPDVTYVEHFIAKNGHRHKDKVVANIETITIPFTFDEINTANLKRFFLASALATDTRAVLQKPLQQGSVSLLVRTEVGTSMVYSIPKAIIRPDGALAIGDGTDWWSGPMVIEVLRYDSGQYASKPFGVIHVL